MGNNQYHDVDFKLELATDDKEEFSQTLEIDKDIRPLNIADREIHLINKDNIVSLPLPQIMEKLKQSTFTTISHQHRSTYFLMHPNFFEAVDYDLNDTDLADYKTKIYGDFRKVYPENSSYYIVDLGSNKYVIILDRAQKIIYYAKDGLKMIGDWDEEYQTVNKNPINFNNLLDVSNPDKFWLVTNKHLFVKPEGKGKYVLKDVFGDKVLPTKFDTIYKYQYFIVGRNGNDYKIYNTYFKELPIKNVRQVFPDRNGLEVIQANELNVYDINGNILKEYYKQPVNEYCGLTTYSESITIKKDDSLYKGEYYLQAYRHDAGYPYYHQDFVITNIPKDACLIFATNSDSVERNNRAGPKSWISESGMVYVCKNALCGMYQIPIVTAQPEKMDSIGKNIRQDVVLPPSEIGLFEKLPIKYKKIYTLKGRIYFESQNGFGIYGIVNNQEFAELKQKGTNYFRVKNKNGKYGWLSLRDNKVLWDT
ncbi:hypothetical protein [Soonwooa sp.]|uniref:hypothetical protein n=1 Tax=Soonwooa sp. TaxID=1938592 RepID=UPI0026080574|nr:hypothetical protein [Soonwooa sp.]